jgi:hypothetical protein
MRLDRDQPDWRWSLLRPLVWTTVWVVLAGSSRSEASDGPGLTILVADDARVDSLFGGAVGIDGPIAIVGAIGSDDACGGMPTCDSGAAYLFDTQTGDQLRKLTANDAKMMDSFGISVGIDQDRVIVGALTDGPAGAASGSAFVFDTTTGEQLKQLTANDAAALDFFGRSVDIDGPTAIVGAILDEDAGPGTGSAYVFDVDTGQQHFKLTADDAARGDWFGRSVAIDGEIAIVGAPERAAAFTPPGTGSAYLFDVTTGRQLAKLVASDGLVTDEFGASVALGGDLAIVGSPGHDRRAGAAYVFDVTTGGQLSKLAPPDLDAGDEFGFSVAIDGPLALVGAWSHDTRGSIDSGAVYVFDVWTGQQRMVAPLDAMPGDQFGYAVALDGDRAIVGARFDDQAGLDAGSAALLSPVVPEPQTLALLMAGLLTRAVCRHRRVVSATKSNKVMTR